MKTDTTLEACHHSGIARQPAETPGSHWSQAVSKITPYLLYIHLLSTILFQCPNSGCVLKLIHYVVPLLILQWNKKVCECALFFANIPTPDFIYVEITIERQ